MLDRLLGIVNGAIVTFLLLLLFDDGRIISNQTTGFAVAIAIGAVVNLTWPIVMSLWISKRAKGRRDELVKIEVQRQLSAKKPQDQSGGATKR